MYRVVVKVVVGRITYSVHSGVSIKGYLMLFILLKVCMVKVIKIRFYTVCYATPYFKRVIDSEFFSNVLIVINCMDE